VEVISNRKNAFDRGSEAVDKITSSGQPLTCLEDALSVFRAILRPFVEAVDDVRIGDYRKIEVARATPTPN